MKLRSLLFVPGDRPERMEKALGLSADALILDLEDSVAPANKPAARAAVSSFLHARHKGAALFVRINPLDVGMLEDDLDAILGAPLAGIMLPKAEDAVHVTLLANCAPGVPILPIAAETPAALFTLGNYGEVSGHLAGLTWGAVDLSSAIGSESAHDEDGALMPPYAMARSLVLFAAHAAEVPAIDTVYPDFRDTEGLARYAAHAARDGFTGMLAIHPGQIPIINAAFTPSAETLAHARAVIAAFDAGPGSGALQLDGKMIDIPHLKRARRLLAQHG